MRATLHCPSCAQAVRVSAKAKMVGYVSTAGLRAALLLVMKELFTDEVIAEFRQRLRRRLEGDRSGELEVAKEKARRARTAYARLLRLTSELPEDDGAIERELLIAAHSSQDAEEALRSIAAGLEKVDRAAIEQQMKADPRLLLEKLFDDTVPIGHAQAILQRLFPRIAFVAKLDRFTSVFETSVVPGTAFAQASGTDTLEDCVSTLRVTVKAGPKRPVHWQAVIQQKG